MPTIRSSSSPGSTSTFHDRFGAYFVRLPLLTNENVALVYSTPDAPGSGTRRWSAGSVRHKAIRAPPVATTGSSGRISAAGL